MGGFSIPGGFISIYRHYASALPEDQSPAETEVAPPRLLDRAGDHILRLAA